MRKLNFDIICPAVFAIWRMFFAFHSNVSYEVRIWLAVWHKYKIHPSDAIQPQSTFESNFIQSKRSQTKIARIFECSEFCAGRPPTEKFDFFLIAAWLNQFGAARKFLRAAINGMWRFARAVIELFKLRRLLCRVACVFIFYTHL